MLETSYAWKPGSRFKVEANTAISELSQCTDDKGCINAQLVVDHARETISPLHNDFEWDDGIAANEHRKHTARVMTASLVTIVTRIDAKPMGIEAEVTRPDSEIVLSPPGEIVTRAFVHVDTAMGSGYRLASAALRNPTERSYLLKQARNDMKVFTDKYSMLDELAHVIKVMREY